MVDFKLFYPEKKLSNFENLYVRGILHRKDMLCRNSKVPKHCMDRDIAVRIFWELPTYDFAHAKKEKLIFSSKILEFVGDIGIISNDFQR